MGSVCSREFLRVTCYRERRDRERREAAVREEEDLRKAIEASRTDFGNDVDWELELAIQASMQQK